jgi:hypothetical protein
MTDPTEILRDGAETYEEKNDDYGDSWRLVGEFLWLLSNDGIELKTKEDFISFGLYTRRLDKIARSFNGEFNDDELNFESVIDSHTDESVYAAMHAANQNDRQGDDVIEDDPLEPTDDEEQVVVIPENSTLYEDVLDQTND